jgi:hypothetical protein
MVLSGWLGGTAVAGRAAPSVLVDKRLVNLLAQFLLD